jgi:PTH1 family peptidyl-tRNA hydrolase
VGFRVVRYFASAHRIALDREEFGGSLGRGTVAREDGAALEVAVLQPLTYMNLSGDAIAEAVASLPLEDPSRDLLVVTDDVDLPFGRLRIRAGGGAGGHRGLADIIERLSRRDFPRLRFGVGRPTSGYETSDYVLQGFSREEEAALPDLVARAAEAVNTVFTRGVEIAMNRYNPDPLPSKGSAPPS